MTRLADNHATDAAMGGTMADVPTGRSRATWALTALVGLCAAALAASPACARDVRRAEKARALRREATYQRRKAGT